MNSLSAASIALLLSLAMSSTHAYEPVPDYPAEQVAERTWVIHGPASLPNSSNLGFMNNPVFTITEVGVVVIDPGSSRAAGDMVLRQIRARTDLPVTHVFATHIHGDHWLGNDAIARAFPAAKFLAHPAMIEMANDGQAEFWLDLMERLTEGKTSGTRAVIPTIELSDGQLIEAGGQRFRVHLSKHAHSKTDAMIEIVDDAVLVLGDNVFVRRIGRMDDGSFRGNIAACQRVEALKVKVFVPGHGPTGDAAASLGYCRYLERLYEEVGLLAEEGLADFEMKPLLEPKFRDFAKWFGFDASFGRHISLAVLEYEQAAFE